MRKKVAKYINWTIDYLDLDFLTRSRVGTSVARSLWDAWKSATMTVGIREKLAREVEIYDHVRYETFGQDSRWSVGWDRRENALSNISP